MSGSEIINDLGEGGFYNALSKLTHVLFVGEPETLSSIKQEISAREGIGFLAIPDGDNRAISFEYAVPPSKLSAIVVASLSNEESLYSRIVESIDKAYAGVPVLKLFSDVFVNFLAGRRLLDPHPLELQIPQLAYAVITTPRSGSTYFCNLLQSTGLAGYPGEHLRRACATLALNCGFDYGLALRRIMANKQSRNRVFGTKLVAHFLHDFQIAGRGFEEVFRSDFSRFIYLKRADRVAQAVSACLAHQTKIWHLNNEAGREAYLSKLSSLVLGDEIIENVKELYDDISSQYEYLDRLFEVYSVNPWVVEYEQLMENPQDALKDVFKFLGIDASQAAISGIKAGTKILRSEASERLAQSFIEKYVNKTEGKPIAAQQAVSALVAEGRQAVEDRDVQTAVACFKQAYAMNPGIYLSCQEKDIEVIEYPYWSAKHPGSEKAISVRGREFALQPGNYFSCIGQDHTFGRFANEPYPELLGQALSLDALNLGLVGAGPGFYADPRNRWLLKMCDKGRLTIVLLMPGLSINVNANRFSSRFYDAGMGKIYKELYCSDRPAFDDAYSEFREKYIQCYIDLAGSITTPKILLWFSGRSPASAGGVFNEGGFEFPDLVYSDILDRIKPYYDRYVEYVSKRGWPQRLTHRETSLPWANCEGFAYNAYYPSPDMHREAADLLLPVCRELISIL